MTRVLGFCLLVLAIAAPAASQAPPPTSADMQAVLDRLDKLEEENLRLQDEIRQLRTQLTAGAPAKTDAAAPPPDSERLDVQESRTAELAQSKVGSSQRFPISLTGMLLFNAFRNGNYGGTAQNPALASPNRAPASDGATLRQTIIGLKVNGPDLPGGGKASGSVYMDFFSGTTAPNNNLVRLRIATLDLTWKNTTISAGQDKPIISPREPDSLAQVGVSPLTAAGNLWDWNPQLRIEQRFSLGSDSGLVAQAGVYETTENYAVSLPAEYAGTLERSRPSYEARLEFFRTKGSARIEIAPGFHFGSTHVAGSVIQSRIASLDWLVRPFSQLEFTGQVFRGEDVAGLGALQGFNISESGTVNGVHTHGEWGQIALFPASRISFHTYAGAQFNRLADVSPTSVTRNFVYAGNVIFKLAPNVRAAFEASQARTEFYGSLQRLNNHYDLALAYLF
jgi:hypothetical protein